MKELIFVVFDDEGGGYTAVEGSYSLLVSFPTKEGLKQEIKVAVNDYFNGKFAGKIILREFKDETFDLS